jgi:hypothetical protein
MPQISLQQVNLGDYANDGTGDDLRTAFEKVNANFAIIETSVPSSLNQDTNPTLAANLNLNGKNIISNAPVALNIGTNKFTTSGPIQSLQFIGKITDISNHSLQGLSDVDYPQPPATGDGLVYKNGIWQPGAVNAAYATVDGGFASAIYNLDEGAVIDGGYADDTL